MGGNGLSEVASWSRFKQRRRGMDSNRNKAMAKATTYNTGQVFEQRATLLAALLGTPKFVWTTTVSRPMMSQLADLNPERNVVHETHEVLLNCHLLFIFSKTLEHLQYITWCNIEMVLSFFPCVTPLFINTWYRNGIEMINYLYCFAFNFNL